MEEEAREVTVITQKPYTFLNNAVSPTNENTCPETYTLQMNVVFQPRVLRTARGAVLCFQLGCLKYAYNNVPFNEH